MVAPSGQQPAPQQGQSYPPIQAPAAQSSDQAYEFITHPQTEPKRSLIDALPGSGTMVGRIGIMAGLLLLLLILFLIVRSVLGGGGIKSTALVSVAQDQQEMLHITNTVTQQGGGLSTANQNFAVTLKASMTTSQSELFTYLNNNKVKLKPKQLNMKVSTTIDQQLAAAKASGTYDQTFKSVMISQLKAYATDLGKAYQQDTGKKGRALINETYQQARLLGTQLTSGN